MINPLYYLINDGKKSKNTWKCAVGICKIISKTLNGFYFSAYF